MDYLFSHVVDNILHVGYPLPISSQLLYACFYYISTIFLYIYLFDLLFHCIIEYFSIPVLCISIWSRVL